MSFSHGSKARLFLDGVDVTTMFKSASPQQSTESAEVTTFNPAGSAKAYIPGLIDLKLAADGFFDGVTGGVAATGTDYAIQSRIGKTFPALHLPAGDGFGMVGFGMLG